MLSPSLAFTDGVGAATITSKGPRFGNWVPDRDDIGPVRYPLGGAAAHAFTFRTEYLATLELGNIPAAQLDLLMRLKAHVRNGGDVTVNTADVANRSYTCGQAPGKALPSWVLDRRELEYTLVLAVKNRAAAPMLCVYQL